MRKIKIKWINIKWILVYSREEKIIRKLWMMSKWRIWREVGWLVFVFLGFRPISRRKSLFMICFNDKPLYSNLYIAIINPYLTLQICLCWLYYSSSYHYQPSPTHLLQYGHPHSIKLSHNLIQQPHIMFLAKYFITRLQI